MITNGMITIGTRIKVDEGTPDEHLIEWLDDRDFPVLTVTDFDDEARLLWTEDCPYAIQYDEVRIIK